ncbi:HlyD family type I secretion periplasmic adaptor subunit [Denitrobaculum tricleocarpae]|uniref:Membrane fusion protein (MFP) family protein n=1 Tax=Denitrobaculum tricleocarpae TaxID=2591009 RepID=A0A545TTH0_9PROT|nr:HlyD family type I secretion periplasmic adaptor subunit [Denitrobaculum tricleocarpae]TQV80516.1 HlyD family type I secretion periplasmic adaptor subunit [Denitrobaculum tricleocarpae]
MTNQITVAPVSATSDETLLKDSLRPIVSVGVIAILLFFGLFGGWATFAPLARGTLAPGIVSPDGSRRTVQHYEGGIIQELRVREGQRVAKGDTVAVLQQIRVRSEHATFESQLFTLLAEQSRLLAEQASRAFITHDPRLMTNASDPEQEEAMSAQEAVFKARRSALENQQSILRQRIKQYEQQIEGFNIQNDSLDRQEVLIREEIAGVQALFDKGLERKPRLLALQRTQAQIDGARGENLAGIARASSAIGEAELEITRLKAERLDEVNNSLADLRVRIAEIEQSLDRTADELERTVIKAPVDGSVINLKFKTIGGVVKAGEAILDIVPARELLVIDARIPPLDIDAVHPGLGAEIILSAYPRRSTPSIRGKVEWISAGIMEDEDSEETYYSARVIVERDAISELPEKIVLYPGMPTEVMIISGERTALDYLLEPLMSSFRRSFTEG